MRHTHKPVSMWKRRNTANYTQRALARSTDWLYNGQTKTSRKSPVREQWPIRRLIHRTASAYYNDVLSYNKISHMRVITGI